MKTRSSIVSVLLVGSLLISGCVHAHERGYAEPRQATSVYGYGRYQTYGQPIYVHHNPHGASYRQHDRHGSYHSGHGRHDSHERHHDFRHGHGHGHSRHHHHRHR